MGERHRRLLQVEESNMNEPGAGNWTVMGAALHLQLEGRMH